MCSVRVPCAVLKCITNKKSFKEEGNNVHCFRIPKESFEELKKILIKPKLQPNAVICERHFSSDDYEWERDVIGANQKVMGKVS